MPARAFCLLNGLRNGSMASRKWSCLNAREGILFIERCNRVEDSPCSIFVLMPARAFCLSTAGRRSDPDTHQSRLNAREGILFIDKTADDIKELQSWSVLMPARAFCLLNKSSKKARRYELQICLNAREGILFVELL